MSGANALFRRDLTLAFRQGGTGWLGAAFFALVAALVPMGIGPEPQILARIAAGYLWIAAVLSTLLSLDRLFQADFDDGTLDQLMLSPLPPTLMVLTKVSAHWISNTLPLIVLAPLLGLWLNLPPASYLPVCLTLIVGTPALSLIGAIGAALTVNIRRGGLILSLLVVPLWIPTLLFGVGAIDSVALGGGAAFMPNLLILAALSLVSAVLSPIAAAAALRLHLT